MNKIRKWITQLSMMGLLGITVLFNLGYSSTSVGTFSSATQSGNQIDITASGGKMRIYVCTPNIIRVSFDTRGKFTSTQDVLGDTDLVRTYDAVTYTYDNSSSSEMTITTSAIKLTIAKPTIKLTWTKADGTALTNETAQMTNGPSSVVTFAQGTNEHFFGWGTAFQWMRPGDNGMNFSMDRKGTSYAKCRETACYMYSTNGYGLFFLFGEPLESGSAWGAISSGNAGASFDLTGSTQKYGMSTRTNTSSSLLSTGTMDYASYYFIQGDWKTAMTGYTLVSGRAPKLGKKFYGIMRDMYFCNSNTAAGPSDNATPADMYTWVDMFRNNKFNMDWIRMDNFQDWTTLSTSNVSTSGKCWNGTTTTAAIDYVRTHGFYFGGMIYGWTYQGCCSQGCTENNVTSVSAATTAVSHGFDWAWYDAMNFQGRRQAHEQWAVWTAAHGGDETKVMVSRGWQALSSQAYPAGHLGDYLNQEWNNFHKFGAFTGALEEALVGYPFSHTDLGEKYEFGYISFALRPMYTIHMAGAAGGVATDFPECAAIGGYTTDMKNTMHKWDNFHYRMIPFLFTYGQIAHETGIPVWRGMMCQNGGESDASTYTSYMQCYVGEELIMSPYFNDCPLDGGASNGWSSSTETATGYRKNIYLPSGTWYDFFPSGAPALSYTGPTTIASYDVKASGTYATKRLPLFVKAGSIIPMMDSLQYVGEKAESEITLNVWPVGMTGIGAFTLYEDETPVKTSFTMTYNSTITQINIGAFAGSKYCSTATARKYRIVANSLGTTAPSAVYQGTTALTALASKSAWDAGTEGYYFDATAATGGICYVNCSGSNQNAGFSVCIGGSCNTSVVNESAKDNEFLLNNISTRMRSGTLIIHVPFAGTHAIEIMNLQGRVIAKRAGALPADYTIDLGKQAKSMYLMKISTQGKSLTKKITL